MSPTLSWTDHPAPAEVAEILALLAAVAEADGVDPVSESVVLRLRHPEVRDGRHLMARVDGVLCGYAARSDGPRVTAEFTVIPSARRSCVGGALLDALLDGDGELWVWAHGDHPGARRLAQRRGLRPGRELLRLHRSLADASVPARAMPDGVRLRAFEPGRDEQAVVEVNARAFSWHPEQGAMSVADLRARQDESWFDPAGFLLAERDGALVGFHWTKRHSATLGEVYVVGVDPDAQGGGLGAALTAAGLVHLRDGGSTEVLLYVEGDNAAALRTYERLGFVLERRDIAYVRSADRTE